MPSKAQLHRSPSDARGKPEACPDVKDSSYAICRVTSDTRQPLVRRLAEASCRISETSPQIQDVIFLCSVFVRFTLPHSSLASSVLERSDGDRAVAFTAAPAIGLPYGKWPRVILSYLSTQAVRTRAREIELGASMSSFLRALGSRGTGGANGTIRAFKTQLLRTLSMSAVHFQQSQVQAMLKNSPVADEFRITWSGVGVDEDGSLPARVTLGERIFQEMLGSAVPLDLRAVRAIQQSPMAFDIYCWTTFRAHRLPGTHPTWIRWSALQTQFGAAYSSETDFRAAFRSALRQVQLVYPALRCDTTQTHLLVWKSPPSVGAAKSRHATRD